MTTTPKSSRLNPVLVIAAVVIAALLFWLYFRGHGTPNAPTAPAPAASAASSAAPAPLSASQVEHGIAETRAEVERNPKDAAGWAMLAHSYEMLGQFDKAGAAYKQLIELHPDDAQARADYADALGVAQHGSLRGEPAALIQRALAIDPANLKALVLGGKLAFEERRYDDAVGLWQRAQAATPDATVRSQLGTSVAEASALAGKSGSGSGAAGKNAAFLSGRLSVAAALAAQLRPDDSVFIYARPVKGSRMPVALLRRSGHDLPMDFALDDSLAMVPTSRLSQQSQVMVGVHVSHRGDAIPASGDLEGEVGPLSVGTTGIQLVVDHVHP